MVIKSLKSVFATISADTITEVVVVVLSLIFFAALIYIFTQTKKWNKLISEKDFTSKELKGFYEKYNSSFISKTGKTHIHASEIFSLTNLRPTYNVVRSIPNMLVGIGILGTFIGLTAGVAPLGEKLALSQSGEGSEVLMEGAKSLLAGMATAFITSVFGMFYSVVLGFVTRYLFGTTYQEFKSFWKDLDDKHFISDSEFELVELERLKMVLINTFGKEIDGNKIAPGNLLWSISDNSEKTVSQLEAFSSDLAEGLMLSTDTIQAIQDKLGSSFSNLFDGKMEPLFTQMVDHLETIKNKNDNDTSKFIGELKESLNQMVASFQDQISEGASDQVKELNGIMLQTANSLNSIPELLENTRGNFTDMLNGFEGAGDEIIKRITESYDQVAEKNMEAQTKVIQSSQNVIHEITQASTNATLEITNAVGQIVDKQGRVSGELDLLLARFKSIMEGTADSQESINNQISDLLSASFGIKNASKELENIFNKANTLIEQTVKLTEMLNSSSSSLTTAQKEFKDIAYQSLQETKSYLSSHLESFEQLKGQTASLFNEMNKGIQAYEATASSSINQYLGDFANQLSAAADSLSGSYGSLRETIEELDDFFETINKKIK